MIRNPLFWIICCCTVGEDSTRSQMKPKSVELQKTKHMLIFKVHGGANIKISNYFTIIEAHFVDYYFEILRHDEDPVVQIMEIKPRNKDLRHSLERSHFK